MSWIISNANRILGQPDWLLDIYEARQGWWAPQLQSLQLSGGGGSRLCLFCSRDGCWLTTPPSSTL